ncbi:MAG: 30S ribosomal protein S1 [Bacteroidota bacterium]
MKETAAMPTRINATDTEFSLDYSDEERAALVKLYEEALPSINEHKIVQGLVVGIYDRNVIISIGGKADGLVPHSEFRDIPELKPGDEVEVYVEEQESIAGQLILSRKKAKLTRAWEAIQDAADRHGVLTAFVKRRTKGGLVVDLAGIEAFLPGSQIDVKPVRDFDTWLGKTLDVAVLKINHTKANIIVSHKALLEKNLESHKSTILSSLEKGQVLEGTVKNITSFGVFIDLGGIDGLLHITEITWRRISHPEEVLALDQKVKVVVTDFDEDKKRISLGMKQLTPHPWEELPTSVQIGSKVKGKVVKLAEYGAFIQILPGVEGLIHISEMTWAQHLRKAWDILQLGQEVEAIVLTMEPLEQKMALSLRQLTEDPWTQGQLVQKYAVGTKHTGIVKYITHFGVWIELERDIEGLLHISDMSWTKKINHPTDLLKPEEQLTLVVLEVDQGSRKLALGLKQLAENPWSSHEATFQVGSIHPGTIVKKTEQGALVALLHNLESFVPNRYLIKENGQKAAIHDKLDFQVIEFSSTDKRITISHTATLKKAKNSPVEESNTHNTSNDAVPVKSTLGDIDTLDVLKEQVEKNNNQ